MKKVLLTVLIISAVVFSASALKSVTLAGSPYSLMIVNSSNLDPKLSDYGFGGFVAYRVNPVLNDPLTIGASVEVNYYHIPGETKEHKLLNVEGTAGVGFKFYVSDNFKITPMFNVGCDVSIAEGVMSPCLVLGPSVTFAYPIVHDAVDIIGEIQGDFSFPKKGETQYSNIRFNFFLGATYKF